MSVSLEKKQKKKTMKKRVKTIVSFHSYTYGKETYRKRKYRTEIKEKQTIESRETITMSILIKKKINMEGGLKKKNCNGRSTFSDNNSNN